MLSEEIKQKAFDAVFHFDIKEAREIAKEMEFEIKKLSESGRGNNGEIEELSKLLIRLKLLGLPTLKDDEVLRLVRESVLEMLNDPDLDLAERIEARQLTIPESLRMEMVNQPIMEALRQNTEIIGSGKIFIAGDAAPVEPAVKNWLLDYDRNFGTGPQQDLLWLEYVKKNAAGAGLNAKETETLRKVFKLYEWLKREPQ